jgi:glutamine amidotransferase-like uncharacterized protein
MRWRENSQEEISITLYISDVNEKIKERKKNGRKNGGSYIGCSLCTGENGDQY